MKDLIVAKLKNEDKLLKCFSFITRIPLETLSFQYSHIYIVRSKVIIDETIEYTDKIHWLDACLMLLNEIKPSDREVKEFGHSLLQSLLGDYDDETDNVEEFLFNNLKSKLNANDWFQKEV